MKERVKSAALAFLINENSSKEKTKDVHFHDLCLSEYLSQNQNTTLAKVTFAIRSKSLDIKTWQPWKYDDNLCVMCHIKKEKN